MTPPPRSDRRSASRGRPRWFHDERLRHRAIRVQELRLKGLGVLDIAAEAGISPRQVFVDLKRARDYETERVFEDLRSARIEQIERRRAIQRHLWREVEKLQGRGLSSTSEATPSYPARAMAVARLIEVITAQEKAIEQLLGFDKLTPLAFAEPDPPVQEFRFDFATGTVVRVEPEDTAR